MNLMGLKIENQADLNMVQKKFKYNNTLIYSPIIIILMNKFQKKGKKHLIEKNLLETSKLLNWNSIKIFEQYLENIINQLLIPIILLSKKKASVRYKIPIRVHLLMSILKSLKTLNNIIKSNYKIKFSNALYLEIKNILTNKGISILTKKNLLKQALSLRVFSNLY
uniref:30S ribosomal protein S7 n=1 Tax=Nephromyces sp. ex Molgula occidentalis TaxID=2544991 RepID=A0A5C1H8J0_9APIC|nr:30S ribosomal protein S7 [Nephromyces sp. ex Molgula occidentalis]